MGTSGSFGAVRPLVYVAHEPTGEWLLEPLVEAFGERSLDITGPLDGDVTERPDIDALVVLSTAPTLTSTQLSAFDVARALEKPSVIALAPDHPGIQALPAALADVPVVALPNAQTDEVHNLARFVRDLIDQKSPHEAAFVLSPPRLSETVERVVKARRQPMTAADFIDALLNARPRSGLRWSTRFAEGKGDHDRKLTPRAWIRETSSVLRWDRIEPLHSQLLILGLGLVDPDLGRRLLHSGLLQAIDRRADRRLSSQLTPHGLAVRQALGGYRVPGFAPDAIHGEDLLGITPDVEGLAAVIAARSTSPPLSVGLFGRWGTGKSFFMARMRERIEKFAQEARRTPQTVEPIFCANVVQITFNAWHYIDANLWASLATHIFEEMDRYGRDPSGDTDPDAARRKENLFRELNSARLMRTEAEHAKREAAARRDAAGTQVAELKRQRDMDISKLAAVRTGEDLSVLFKSPRVREEALAAADDLGLSNFSATVDDLTQLRELRSLTGKILGGWRALGGLRWLWLLLTLSIGTALVFAVASVGVPAQIVAAVAPVAAVVAAATRQALPLVRAARRINEAVESERKRKEAKLDAELDLAERELVTAEAAVRQADEQVRIAQSSIDETGFGYSLRRFIERRASSSDYQRQLGLISLLQRDFSRMSQLLSRSEGHRTAEPGRDLPTIDRVVLYIDDLDRCPSRLVVEVLQAVHLLLAFDLFVVVVGVDPRWLASSLSRHHRAMLDSSTIADEPHEGTTSTPRDYLEKIFQIPFALDPLSIEGYERMLAELVPVSGSYDTSDPEPLSSRDAADEAIAAPAPTTGRQQSLDLSIDSGAYVPHAGFSGERLLIEAHELAALRVVGPMIPTPRAVKRLANIYRLIRAGVPPVRLGEFIKEDEGAYAAVIVLLGLLVGFPQDFEAMGNAIRTTPAVSWEEFLSQSDRLNLVSDGAKASLTEITARRVARDYPLAHFREWLPHIERYSFGI